MDLMNLLNKDETLGRFSSNLYISATLKPWLH